MAIAVHQTVCHCAPSSDCVRNVYTDADAVPAFSTSPILVPASVTLLNLFVNGILQSPNLYTVQPRVLIRSDVPTRGVPLILQFVRMMLPAHQR